MLVLHVIPLSPPLLFTRWQFNFAILSQTQVWLLHSDRLKEDLIRSVVEYLLQQFMTAYLPGSPFEMRTPLERIRGELAEMHYLLQEKPDMFIVLDELILRSLHDPAIHNMITWLDERWHSYLEQVIREGIE